MSSTGVSHWLNIVAAHAGLELGLPDEPSFAELSQAWPRVVAATGMSDEAFAKRVAGHFRVGLADFGAVDPQAVKLIPEAVARRYAVVAISATESTILVATSDPSTPEVRREIMAYANRQPTFAVARPSELAQAIERAYAPPRAPKNALQTLIAEVAAHDFQVASVNERGAFTSFELDEPALVKLTQFVLHQGVRFRATEIHVEPGAQRARVRFRIDGVMQHLTDLPTAAHTKLVARLKHVARLQSDRTEDGFPVRLGDVEKRARLTTTSSPDGELVLIRLVDPVNVPRLEDLNLDFAENAKIRQLLQRKDGVILVTGPARSGTTSFIYAALDFLRTNNVISLESRPEMVVPGVTQIRWDPSGGTSFAESLQALLDRSPDVLHAGEIRDLATARVVLRVAVTGRKVLATMHTPDAVSGVRRLVEMGLAPSRLAESLHAVVSLRLVRRLCEKCARPYDPQKDAKSREAMLARQLNVSSVKYAVGCQVCAGTGYLGQIPIPEILVITPALREVLSAGPSDAELLRAARGEGMRTFGDVALGRVAKGDTTVEEVERVLGIVPPITATAGSVGPVLVVEDGPEDRLLACHVLRDLGFRVLEADSASAALALLKSNESFSLALIDLYLPELDGLELLRYIRRSLATQSLPVIVVTASDDPGHEHDLLDAGADDYLVKPVVPKRLKSRVRAVLRRAGVRLDAREASGPGAPSTDAVSDPL